MAFSTSLRRDDSHWSKFSGIDDGATSTGGSPSEAATWWIPVAQAPSAELPAVEAEAAGAWFRAESNRQELERRATLSMPAICAAVDRLWRSGVCPERRWTNCREICYDPEIPEEVHDFPPSNESLLVPRARGSGAADSAAAGAQARLQVGDRVRVVVENTEGFDAEREGTTGMEGRIMSMSSHIKGRPPFQVQLQGRPALYFEGDWLAAGPRAGKGDMVRVVVDNGPGNFNPERKGTRGAIGTVLQDYGPGPKAYDVKLRDGRIHVYDNDWVAKMGPVPNVGDRARVLQENPPGSHFDPERTGTEGLFGYVFADDTSDLPFGVVLDDKRRLKYMEDWLELAPFAALRLTTESGAGIHADILGDFTLVEQPQSVKKPLQAFWEKHHEGSPTSSPGKQGCWHAIKKDSAGRWAVVRMPEDLTLAVSRSGARSPHLVPEWGVIHKESFIPIELTVQARRLYFENWVDLAPSASITITAKASGARMLKEMLGEYKIVEEKGSPTPKKAALPYWRKAWIHEGTPGSPQERMRFHVVRNNAEGRWAVVRMPDEVTLAVSQPHRGKPPHSISQWAMVTTDGLAPLELSVQARKQQKDGCGGCLPNKEKQKQNQKRRSVDLQWTEPFDPSEAGAQYGSTPGFQSWGSKERDWVRLVDYAPCAGPGTTPACNIFLDDHKTHCGRVFQGELDNAYLVEALNAISLRPKLVRQLFYGWNLDFSVYALRLFKNGTWLCVEVDDLVPTRLNNEGDEDKPFCCRSEHFPEVLWPSLVEKAYAKACTIRILSDDSPDVVSGGWLATAGGGRVDEALVDLTGGVASSFSLRDVAPDRLFIYLYELQRDCLFVCRVDVDRCSKHGVQLNPFASHAVNRAVHTESRCYVQIFCASPDGVHCGGLQDLVVPEQLMREYPERAADGFFWLEIHDFHYYFHTIFECRLTNSPDVGIEGMPPSRLPNARSPSQGIPLKPEDKATHMGGLTPRTSMVGASLLPNPMQASGAWHPSGAPLPPLGSTLGMPPWMQGDMQASGVPPWMQGGMQTPGLPVPRPMEERPLFFETVFANSGTVSERVSPEFDLILPNLPCEVVICMEQTCARVQQVGPHRKDSVAILIKVYEHLVENAYASDLICKSGWMPVRGAMVSFKSMHGGHFKVKGEMLSGEKCDRMIMRCYTSVSAVTVSPGNALQKHFLARRDPAVPPNAMKWTLVGCTDPSKLPRLDLPIAPDEDLDAVRQRHGNDRCCVM